MSSGGTEVGNLNSILPQWSELQLEWEMREQGGRGRGGCLENGGGREKATFWEGRTGVI